MSEPKSERNAGSGVYFATRWFLLQRIAFYLVVAFLIRENVRGTFAGQSDVLSSDFTEWSATFPSRLDRAMAMDTGVAE